MIGPPAMMPLRWRGSCISPSRFAPFRERAQKNVAFIRVSFHPYSISSFCFLQFAGFSSILPLHLNGEGKCLSFAYLTVTLIPNMKYILLLVIAVILLFDLSKFFFYKTQKLPEVTQSSHTFGKGEDLVYIAAGDSTALGVGATHETEIYTYLVAENLGSENKVIYKNIGVSGAQTIDVIKNQLPQIIDSRPRIITISIGANDVTHLKSPTSIVENYQTIKSELMSKTDSDVFISNIPSLEHARILPLWFRKLLELRVVETNRRISGLASERFHIVDVHSSISYTPETYAKDKFHPSDAGYKNWAKVYLESISRKTRF